MAKKIYDFLPAHLKNSELETIVETTLDRAFSQGEMEKTKAFVGRKEKGIYNENDIYLSFPAHAFSRDNYGLEPTFTNVNATDNVFYEDLFNALFNKGSLTNDHRRLFKTDLETVQLPIDLDKFINYAMYYWVSPGFFSGSEQSTTNKHYITIDKGASDWWSSNNSWYHYDDIRSQITDSNYTLISQALRPIIEFDNNIELSNGSATATEFDIPEFKAYDSTNTFVQDIKIFHYVTGSEFAVDQELDIQPKLKAGDYQSEFIFNIDLLDNLNYKYNSEYKNLYTTSTFDYRNLRQELGNVENLSQIELLQEAKNVNDIDLYVDGIKQIGNYTYNNVTNKINTTSELTGYIYVDYCTKDEVIYDGDEVFQRLQPALEYNVDNLSYVNIDIPYSTIYEHIVRIIETTNSLVGKPNGVSNYRNLGDNSDKLRHANQGSVLIRNTVDIKEAYFAITRDDYDPFLATEFLSNAYNGYKNKILTTVIDILSSSASKTKTDLQILEEAVSTISLGKQQSISIFRDSKMINFGEEFAHYEELQITITPGSSEQVMPNFVSNIVNDEDIVVIVDNVVQRFGLDYTIPIAGNSVDFTSPLSGTETAFVRLYKNIKLTYIPPSATSLKIHPAFEPKIITDLEYDDEVGFIQGHDGSLMPAYSQSFLAGEFAIGTEYEITKKGNTDFTLIGAADNDVGTIFTATGVGVGTGIAKFNDRIDKVMLMFETLIYNRLDTHSTNIDSMNYGLYDAQSDYSNAEKKYMLYPFFKKWMMRNNIDNLYNDIYDATDWKTWNYRAKNEDASGHWRGLFIYIYGTDKPMIEPWRVLKLSQKPSGFDQTYLGNGNYYTHTFWNDFINKNSLTIPVPIDSNGFLKEPKELFFGGNISSEDIANMDQDWEFGDNSPVELAWTRSSEYPFANFLLMMLSSPFEVLYNYSLQVKDIITYFNTHNGIDTTAIVEEKQDYTFKLGSKLGGFVNNFKLLTENNSLSNSRFTEIPEDNYDLFVHTGEPNRSEFFSALIIEKVSLDSPHPVYAFADLSNYTAGMIVLNLNDNKYYKRKVSELTTKEQTPPSATYFDYSGWTLISQPKTGKFGYRVHGYDEINPVFYSMAWDKASGEKVFSTEGDLANLQNWQEGEYYRQDSYVVYNKQPYVCLVSHTATSIFDDNYADWKALSEWPRENRIQSNGYKELLDDTLKTYNYGDILESIDDVTHLIMGYQEYLKAVGWDFTDLDDTGEVVDWENLLYKFLDWQAEQHQVGDFITLTPMLMSGSFSAPYGVASVRTETHKNFYRVVDASSRLIPNTEIKFYTNGETITFRSNVPVYGMKMDISDVEHAFVVDRVDSYNDVIYNPLTHDRNLRMKIDCNRTVDWDGTLTADGYIVYDNKLIPNFDTMIAETEFYRDTLVDQSLSIINKLKASQIGYTERTYLTNHGVERESQLEFYKGFLSHKGTNSSINRILNNNSNFKDIQHETIWAFKLGSYGHIKSTYTLTNDNILVTDMISDPFLVEFDAVENPMKYKSSKRKPAIKNAGYVDSNDVNYIVKDYDGLSNLDTSNLYEGDTAWIQFDKDRDWDVARLSEIAEISYIGETNDNQLYLGLTSEIDADYLDQPIYLKISGSEIDPSIADYYLLTLDGTRDVDSVTIYEYLVFEQDFEPVIVEIDVSTTNSIYVPTSTDSGVEAIGTASNPIINIGDTLYIDGTEFVYSSVAGGGASGITILGSTANPVVEPGERASFVIYDANGLVVNTNTTVIFTGTVAQTTGGFSSTYGDQITIDGATLTVDYSATNDINLESNGTTSSTLDTGKTVVIDGVSKAVADIIVTGTTTSPVISSTTPLVINGETITLTAGDDLTAIVDAINAGSSSVQASDSSNQLQILSSFPKLVMSGGALIELGISSGTTYSESKLENLAVELDTITNITATVNIDNKLVIESSAASMVISGTALLQIGLNAGTYERNQAPTQASIVDQITALVTPGVNASVTSGQIRIESINHDLEIAEVTSGAMSRLGFATTTVTVNATDNIVDDLNNQVFTSASTTAQKDDKQVKISSNEQSIVVANIQGNPLTDIGIPTGTYSNTATVSTSAVEFASQINSASSSIVVNISSDGRMIFTSNGTSMSFVGSDSALLTTIGLVSYYSSVTSNSNYKAMFWKSLRYTPNFGASSFNEFYSALGLNSGSLIWADAFQGTGWAVLKRSTTGSLSIHARQSAEIDTELVHRVVVKDGETFIVHNLYDPLNLKMPGAIVSKLDYVSWSDPARYDYTGSIDIWLDEKVGEIWWDTDDVRFYRYNDYGDENANLQVDYVTRHWGQIVPGSTVSVKRWTKTRTLPATVSQFNVKKYFDTELDKEITEYFYWDTSNDVAEELAVLISTGQIKNKFIPVGPTSILLSNNAYLYGEETIKITVEYRPVANPGNAKVVSDWELIGENTDTKVPAMLVNDMTESLANMKVPNIFADDLDSAQLADVNNAIINISWIEDLSINDIVVTLNNSTIPAKHISINGANLQVSQQYTMVVGDILRAYQVDEKTDNWFGNLAQARINFATFMNSKLANKLLLSTFPKYNQYINNNELIFGLTDWYFNDSYKDIKQFSYLSTTRNFDMLKEYKKGTKSFKIQLPTHDEYYFEDNGSLKLVNMSDGSLKLSFQNIVYPDANYTTYYNNAIGIQIYEFMNMLNTFETDKFINETFFTMIKYLFTEKTYPDWVFKTSYIDLKLYNRDLRQYAVYQRDSEEDTIEYINETKPYHVKVRDIERIYSTNETANTKTTIAERMNITLNFGNNSRYEDQTFDGGDYEILSEPGNLDEIGDGTWEQGTLLRNRYTPTSSTTGFDTGLVRSGYLDAAVLRLQTYNGDITGGIGGNTIDNTKFYVYDKLGRGYSIDVTDSDTISSFDGTTLEVTTQSKFKTASGKDKKLIAVERPNSSQIEFMMYDAKANTSLTISDRTLYTGLGYAFETGSKVYILGTPLQIVLHDLV
jgi:hypothetical protein